MAEMGMNMVDDKTGADSTTVTDDNSTKDLEDTEDKKTYTAEEVKALLQRETDRKVTSALKKADKKKADEVKEAERLAKMSESERYEEELKQRENAIAEKENQLALAENKNECAKILSDKGLPVGLVDFVVAVDADDMHDKIKTLDKYFKNAVKAEVEKRLSSTTPKKNLPVDGVITKEQFKKMPLSQQQQLYINNRELYDSLI